MQLFTTAAYAVPCSNGQSTRNVSESSATVQAVFVVYTEIIHNNIIDLLPIAFSADFSAR